MQALLPYLKQIADALGSNAKNGDKKRDEELTSIAKNIVAATVTNNNVSMAGNANTKAISDTLAKGLIVRVQEGGSEVEKSIFALMFEMLQNALFITVTENGQQVTKGIARLLKEQNEALGAIKGTQDGILEALATGTGQSATSVINELVNVNANLSTIGTNIGSGNETLNSIDERLETANETLDNIDDNTQNIQVTAYVSPSEITDAIDDSIVNTIANNSNRADDKLALIQGGVASIDSKIPNPNS